MNTFPSGQVQETNAAGIVPRLRRGYVASSISELRFAAGHPPTLFPPVQLCWFFFRIAPN